MRPALRAFIGDRRGSIAVEFALVCPLVLVALVPVIDLGTGFYRRMQVQAAAQRAAVYATVKGFDSAGISNVIAGSRGSVSASPAPRQFCACPQASGLSEVSCSSTCTLPGASFAPGTYVAASAQATYRPAFAYPGVSSPMVFQASQVVRIK